MRYLDIDKTIKAFEKQHGETSTLLNCYDADWIVSFLEAQPTADVQEVRRGRWNTINSKVAQCSVCGVSRDIRTQVGWNFCPVCGAKMGEEEA